MIQALKVMIPATPAHRPTLPPLLSPQQTKDPPLYHSIELITQIETQSQAQLIHWEEQRPILLPLLADHHQPALLTIIS